MSAIHLEIEDRLARATFEFVASEPGTCPLMMDNLLIGDVRTSITAFGGGGWVLDSPCNDCQDDWVLRCRFPSVTAGWRATEDRGSFGFALGADAFDFPVILATLGWGSLPPQGNTRWLFWNGSATPTAAFLSTPNGPRELEPQSDLAFTLPADVQEGTLVTQFQFPFDRGRPALSIRASTKLSRVIRSGSPSAND